uniref:Zinc finger, CCHC-type n=1 Tax=Caenorhabditis tropicalis TaxID=1561998 RepID=A0A1I7TXY8_9PELO
MDLASDVISNEDISMHAHEDQQHTMSLTMLRSLQLDRASGAEAKHQLWNGYKDTNGTTSKATDYKCNQRQRVDLISPIISNF